MAARARVAGAALQTRIADPLARWFSETGILLRSRRSLADLQRCSMKHTKTDVG